MSGSAQDAEEIRQVIARYCHYLDSVQPKLVASLFSDDAIVDIDANRVEGIGAIEAFYEGLRAVYDLTPMVHHVTNVVIDIDGDDATSQSYILVLNLGNPTAVGTTGRYDDRLRRIDGEWRFVARRAIFDGPRS
jgi:ketosteroid isomerase-like protein